MRRKIIWYHPPFNLLTKTNLGKEFFKILDSSFPKEHSLHTTFNRNTVKLSYSCLPNVQSKISSHNKKILYNRQDNPSTGVENCSCPSSKKSWCLLNGRCLDINIIYQATVKNVTDNTYETYIGLTATSFKDRLGIRKASFRSKEYNQTTLSKHLWQLKYDGKFFDITYK